MLSPSTNSGSETGFQFPCLTAYHIQKSRLWDSGRLKVSCSDLLQESTSQIQLRTQSSSIVNGLIMAILARQLPQQQRWFPSTATDSLCLSTLEKEARSLLQEKMSTTPWNSSWPSGPQALSDISGLCRNILFHVFWSPKDINPAEQQSLPYQDNHRLSFSKGVLRTSNPPKDGSLST